VARGQQRVFEGASDRKTEEIALFANIFYILQESKVEPLTFIGSEDYKGAGMVQSAPGKKSQEKSE